MATVIGRTFRSNPYRDALGTWNAIVELLVQGKNNDKKRELLSVAGTVAMLIIEHFPKVHPIVVTCDGPRTKIYCTYDEDAIDGSGENENSLAYDPLKGDWAISLPCGPDDLDWVKDSLKKNSLKITARDIENNEQVATDITTNSSTLTIDSKAFLEL